MKSRILFAVCATLLTLFELFCRKPDDKLTFWTDFTMGMRAGVLLSLWVLLIARCRGQCNKTLEAPEEK